MKSLRRRLLFVVWSVLVLAVGWGVASRFPMSSALLNSPSADASKDEHGHDDHDHGDHGHDHHEEELPTDITLSDQARENLQLKTGPVKIRNFWRTITIPAEVQEKEGHSESLITATVSGLIGKVHVLPGQLVSPGDSLFDIQTTGDVLANAQSALLKTIQELDLVETQMIRLKPITDQGGVPAVRLLEKQYEKQRLEIQRQVQIQELLVRGISLEQVEKIIKTKVLL
ncbi:MAG: hypothetical protein KDA68_01270, partial [Planctomycetaceae bacterium]|nr:hypothetical protein [Planctomycetaceae bacterium]